MSLLNEKVFDVRRYGADPTGVSDSSAAFAAAITLVNNLKAKLVTLGLIA